MTVAMIVMKRTARWTFVQVAPESFFKKNHLRICLLFLLPLGVAAAPAGVPVLVVPHPRAALRAELGHGQVCLERLLGRGFLVLFLFNHSNTGLRLPRPWPPAFRLPPRPCPSCSAWRARASAPWPSPPHSRTRGSAPCSFPYRISGLC